MTTYCELAEKRAQKLGVIEDGQVKITKELVQSLFDMFCTMSKLH